MNSISKTLRAILIALISSSTIFAAARPNVLFLAVDDMRVELGCYGQTWIHSPNIDRLAKQSTLFQRAYCQQAVCNPSRASLLTGRRPHTLGIYDLPTHFRDVDPTIVTLPELFKKNGYHTQNIGKIFHNWRQDKYKGDAQSWSVPSQLHYARHGDDKARLTGSAVVPPDLSNVPKCEIRDVPDDAYFDGQVAKLAIEALRNRPGAPFFLAVGFWKPHAHFNAPKRYWDMYDRASVQRVANPKAPRDAPLIALHDSREILRAFKDRPDGRPTDRESTELRRGYYAAISYVDAQIGIVLRELEDLGLRKNTVIVLWSDHGFHLGEHSLWAKTSNFELDARVPLLISLPNQKHAAESSSIVELLDLYPTLAELCELSAPQDLQGESLVRLLSDPTQTVKEAALTQHPRPAYPEPGTNPAAMGYSIRTNQFRYTEWQDFEHGNLLATELYDHFSDPLETINLAGKSELRPQIKNLSRQLNRLINQKNRFQD